MSSYHRLPFAAKRAEAIARMREPAVSCPNCDTQVMPEDLLAHMDERCSGPRDPGPSARWVTVRDARAMGVKPRTLNWWAERGFVRIVGERQDRKYLLRDLALKVAQQRGLRRR